MKTLRLLSVVALIGLSSCDGMFPFGNDITKKDVQGQWTPIQYEENGVTTVPREAQRNDYIHFKSNGDFVCVEETKIVEGTWYYTRLNTTINVMVDEENPDDCIPWKVESVSDTELVYTMQTDSGGAKKVWLVK
ncbi:MAG: hypothetical protein ACPGU4_14675 [Flavobacteriales bacterium]